MPQMELTLVGCTGLPNTETFGKIDPYCTVQFEGKTWKTDECEDTTEPQWNKTFKFNIADENSSQAHICVWNKNTMSDDFLGDFWMSVGGLVRGKPDDRKVLLTKCQGNAELHVIVTAVDFGAVEESPQTQYQQRPPMAGYAPPANYIQPPPVYNPPPPPANYNYSPPPPAHPQPVSYPPPAQEYSGNPVATDTQKVKKSKKDKKVKKDKSKTRKNKGQAVNIQFYNKSASTSSSSSSSSSSTTYTDDTSTTTSTDSSSDDDDTWSMGSSEDDSESSYSFSDGSD